MEMKKAKAAKKSDNEANQDTPNIKSKGKLINRREDIFLNKPANHPPPNRRNKTTTLSKKGWQDNIINNTHGAQQNCYKS